MDVPENGHNWQRQLNRINNMSVSVSAANDINIRALTKTEKIQSRHMATAWQAPLFNIVVDVNMQHALDQRKSHVTITDIILFACAQVLPKFPAVNALYQNDSVHEYASANVGLAVTSERGLTVPVIHDANQLNLDEVAERRRTLVEKVRNSSLAISDVVGGTFTVSNLGMFGVKQFTAIINPPQVAILAVGSTRMCQVWNNGDPQWQQISSFALTCDHRAIDGALASRFMSALKADLEGNSNVEGE